MSAQDPTPRNQRKVAVFCSNFLRTAAWPALYQRDLTVILPPTRFLATAHVTIISKPLNLSELLSLPGGPGLFSSKLSLYAVHKHSHRKKVKIGWTETRNKRETRIGQLEEQFKQ